ncbi:MAG: VOC family protein [Gammaproteobacteria bacterium]|nr:VOC family protein [Gammaproteobacteria bacterium]
MDKDITSSIRHVGFVVKDLELSLKFYSDILGLEVYRRFTEEGDFIDKLTGINNVKLEWVKLIIPKGGLIELLQYHSHPDPDISDGVKRSESNRLGCSHVALTVTNLSDLYGELISNGYECKSEPLIAPGGKAKILYALDPDGAILELIEDL